MHTHIMDDIDVYCVNFQDDIRKTRMIQRFQSHQIPLNFVEPVFTHDTRIDSRLSDKRTCSIMLQHLDSIRTFYETSTKPYAIICEDDILISTNFKKDLPRILELYRELNLDVLLLGYLLPFKPNNHSEFPLFKEIDTYKCYDFPYHLWGSQMYLIHREHAKFLLDKYTMEYAVTDLNRPFNPDWTLTKDKKKGILYPMLAIEEGNVKTDHDGQRTFHEECFRVNYIEHLYS